MHTLFDVRTSIPNFQYVTPPRVHDVNVLDVIHDEFSRFYIRDKAYIDFKWLFTLHWHGAYYVTRAKDNMRFQRIYSRTVDRKAGVLYDRIGML